MSKINIQTLILKSCCWKNSSGGIPRQRLATNLQSAKNAASAECSEARVCTQTGSPGLHTRGLREGVQGGHSAQSWGSPHTRPFCPRVWLGAQVSLSTSHCGDWRGQKVETQSDSTLVHVTCLGTSAARPPHFVDMARLPGSLQASVSSTSWRTFWGLARQHRDPGSPLRAGGPSLGGCLSASSFLSVWSSCYLP